MDISLALLPHAVVISSFRSSILACVYFQIGKVPCFTNNATCMTMKTQNWLGTMWQQPWVSSSKFTVIVVNVNDPMTPSHPIFSCLLFTICVDYDVAWCMTPNCLPLHHLCRLWCSLMCESKLSWIICGHQWYLGQHQSGQVFIFSWIFVGNGSIRTTMFRQCLGC